MSLADPLLVERDQGVLTLTLNRPERLNAIDNTLARALLRTLEGAARDGSVRAVLLCGAGRAFCAGRDVSAPPTEEDLVLVQAVARAIVTLPQPVVVAVQGWAVGAGLEWMLDADVVIAADDARFKLPEAALGVFVTGGLSATLSASAGLARAKALMLLGDAFSAHDAQGWGLVWQVVPAKELASAAMQAARRIAALDPKVAARFKRVLNDIGLPRFEAAITAEDAAQREFQRSGD